MPLYGSELSSRKGHQELLGAGRRHVIAAGRQPHLEENTGVIDGAPRKNDRVTFLKKTIPLIIAE
jgi:hypothetical protein